MINFLFSPVMAAVRPVITMSAPYRWVRLVSFTFLCLLLLICGANGQNLTMPKAPLPPTPAAAAILKHVDMPVSYYTGVPEISVPLYELSGRDIKLPINLTFNSNGLKVGEIASWVGNGWTLSSSGAIGRTIHDDPDSFSFGYASDDMNQYYDTFGRPIVDSCATGNPVGYLNSDQYIFYRLLSTGSSGVPSYYDTEPDLYTYSLPNSSSGKFVIDRNNKIKALPKTRTLIDAYRSGGAINDIGFIIRDENGLDYDFQNAETIETHSISNNAFMNVPGRNEIFHPTSSWHISSIRSHKMNEIVSFGYSEEVTEYNTPTMYSQGFLLTPTYPADGIGYNYTATDYNLHTHTKVNGVRLSSISLDNVTVYFLADAAERSDLDGGHRLKQLVVIQNSVDTIKNFKFFHSYQGDFLTLDSVVEFGRNGKRLPGYTFNYYQAPTAATVNSPSRDLWGYYNGAMSNNGSLIPTYHYDFGAYEIHYYGADRDPNFTFTNAGMLSQVTYPTGGFTQYEYEANTYSRFGLDFEKLPQETYVGIDPAHPPSTIDTGNWTAETEFVIPKDTRVRVESISTCNTDVGIPSDCNIIIIGVDISHNVPLLSSAAGSSFVLPAGTYKIKAKLKTTYTTPIGARLQWIDLGDTLKSKIGPGVRVKKISAFDGIHSAPALVRNYKYEFENGVSSGLLFDIQRFAFDYIAANNSTTGMLNMVCEDDYPYTLRVLQSENLNSFLGITAPLGYDRVEEIQVPSGNQLLDSYSIEATTPGTGYYYNGKTVHEFYNHFGPMADPSPEHGTPSTPISAFSATSGKQKRETHYSSTGVLLKESQYFYKETSAEWVWGFQAAPASSENCKKCEFAFAQYVHESVAVEMDSVVEKTYLNGTAFTQITDMQYDFITTVPYHDSFLINRGQSVINSTGENRFTRNWYSFDFSGQLDSANLKGLTGANLLTPVMQISGNANDNTVTGGKLLNYKLISGEYLHLDKYFDLEIESPVSYSSVYPITDITNPPSHFVLKGSFIYSSGHNLTSIQKPNDNTNSFIWALYEPSQMIAEVKNATPAQIHHDSFEESGGTTDSNAKTGKKSRSSSFTFTPPSGLTIVANSTLSYWYWSSGQWNYKEILYSGGSLSITDGTKIDELRIFPPGALMTTYCYWPGVGILNVTDPNNITRKYTYDDFNRLSATKDNDGNILQTYKYFYNLK